MTESPLSDRERELLELVATGASNKEISQKLFISINTVKVHLRNIYSKLDVASRTEAAMWAVQNGLVDTGGDTKNLDNLGAESVLEAVPLLIWFNKLPPLKRFALILAVMLLLVFLGYEISNLNRIRGNEVNQTNLTSDESQWQTLSPMITARRGFAAAAFNGRIYVIGGEGSEGILSSVEILDVSTNQWVESKPKPIPVTDVLGGLVNGKIFVPGGREPSGKISDAFQMFDIQSETWSDGPKLPYPISRYGLGVIQDQLFVVGGWDGEKYLDTVIIYKEDTGWEFGPSLHNERADLSVSVMNQQLYVFGGVHEHGQLMSMEVLSPLVANASWETLSDSPFPLVSIGIASVIDAIYLSIYNGKVIQFIPNSDTWREINGPAILDGIQENRAIYWDANLYLLGGRVGENVTANVFSYRVLYTLLMPVVVR